MPHDAGASVGKLHILHRGKKCLDFDLDSLRRKLPCTSARHISEAPLGDRSGRARTPGTATRHRARHRIAPGRDPEIPAWLEHATSGSGTAALNLIAFRFGRRADAS
jgi:hypothetical protein